MYEGDDLLYTNVFIQPDQSLSSQPVPRNIPQRYNKPRTTYVTIDSRDRDHEMYPDPNHYKITFNRELINVRSVRLVSSEFPNTAQTIYSDITNVYWISLEDTSPVYYDAVLDPGNYTLPEFISHITDRMNSVNRYSDNTPHEFIVTASTESNIVQFQSIQSTFLGTNPIALTAGSRVITVTHPGHTFRIGDFVVIVASTDVGSVTQSVINTTHEIIFVTANTYQIVISTVSPESLVGGGSAVKAGVNKPFMFMNSNTDIPMPKVGFPQQDSSQALEYPIEFINNTPPDLDTAYTVPRVTNNYTGPAWLKSTGHTLVVGDTIQIRGTDTIPSILGVQTVTSIPDGQQLADDTNYFSVGATGSTGTVIKVVNKQSLYTNTNLGNVVESLDLSMRYITGIAKLIDSFITAASPHLLTNISNVYIAYTNTSPNVNGVNGVRSVVFTPADPTKFSIDTDILGVISTSTAEEFVKVTQTSANGITKIIRKNNGTLTLDSSVFFNGRNPIGTTPFLVYIGLPADPLKTPWSVPNLNSYTAGLHTVYITNFPGTTEAFSDPSVIELTTEITDIIAGPLSREIVIVDAGTTSILDIISISLSNPGYLQASVALNTIFFAAYPALNIIFLLHTEATIFPDVSGYRNSARVNITDPAYPNGTTFSLTTAADITAVLPWTQQESFVYVTGVHGAISGVYTGNNGLIRDLGMNVANISTPGCIVTFDGSTITHSAGMTVNGGILLVNKMYPVSGSGYPDSFDTLSVIDDPLGTVAILNITPFSPSESTVNLAAPHEFFVGEQVFIRSSSIASVNNKFYSITSAVVGSTSIRINLVLGAVSNFGALRALGRYTIPQSSGIAIDPGVNGTFAPVAQIEWTPPGYTRITTVFPNTTTGLAIGNAVYIRDTPSIANGIRGIRFIVNVVSPTQFDLSVDLTAGFPVTAGGSTIYIKLATGINSFYTPTSMTMGDVNAVRIQNHNFPVSPAPFVAGNLLLTGINTNPVTAVNDPHFGMPGMFSAITDPNSPHTIRAPADIEVIDQHFIRLLGSRPNVITGFTTPDPNYSVGTTYMRYAITGNTYSYPLVDATLGTTGSITTSGAHLLSVNDKVYIEGPTTVTIPSGGIQGIRTVTVIDSGLSFQINTEVTGVTSSIGKCVKIDPTQTAVTGIISAEPRTHGTITTNIDLNTAIPPGGGFGYPSQFDIYVANANVVTTPVYPLPGAGFTPAGGSLRNITFTVKRISSSYSGMTSNTFEPGISNNIQSFTTTGNPVTVTFQNPHLLTIGQRVYILDSANMPDNVYVVSGTPTLNSIQIIFAVFSNVAPRGRGIIQTGPTEPFYISSVPSIPAWTSNVVFANSSTSTQPIKIVSISPKSTGAIELDNTTGIAVSDNVYIEGTSGIIDGIQTVNSLIPPNQIELSVVVTTPGVLRSAVIDISYAGALGTVIFDISHTPGVTFLIGEPVTITGHSVSSYNVFAYTVLNTDPGKTIELSGLVYVGNGIGGTITSNYYGRLIRTASSSIKTISNITQGVSPAVYTAIGNDFSGSLVYIFGTLTSPDQNGLHTNATILSNDSFSLPTAVTVANSEIVLQNVASVFSKQALRTTVGYVSSIVAEPTRTVITTTSVKNPNKIAYPILRSTEGNPCTFYATGHTFLNGSTVTIINHNSKPIISGSHVIFNVVLGVSFEIATNMILGCPVPSGSVSGLAPDYPGHTLRSLSGSFGVIPVPIVKIYHGNPARIVISKTLFESERLLFSGSHTLPPSDLTLPTPIVFGQNEFAVTRVFYKPDTELYSQYLINANTMNRKAVTAVSLTSPVVISIALPVVLPLQEVPVRFDTNIPDGNYIIQNVTGPDSFEINYDNTLGTNMPTYGYVYTSLTAEYTHYKIVNITTTNPAVITIAAHDYLAGDTVLVAGDANLPAGEYNVVSIISGTQVSLNYDNTAGTGVAPFGTVDNRETTGGVLSRAAIQMFTPVIMTSAAHGLVTGHSIVISDSDAFPSIDGRHAITVIDSDTFSITNGNVVNQVRGTTGNWVWGDQIVLHNLSSQPSINDIIYDITRISDTQFSIPVVLDKIIDANSNITHWGTNRITVQYNGHGLKSGDLISMYNVEDVGGVIAATLLTVHGSKTKNVETKQEQLTRKRVSVNLILDTVPGSETLGQMIPDPNNFDIYASGYHLTFKDIITDYVNGSNKSPNRLLDAYSKDASAIGGGYSLAINCRDQNVYDQLNGFRNYGFANTQSNLQINGLLNKAVELDGDDYLYILNGILSDVSTSSPVRGIFAKILLNSAPGSVVFNTFVSSIKNFNESPLQKITELEFSFVDRQGDLYDFHGVDHSMTFEVSEYVDVIPDTNVSGRRGVDDRTGITYIGNCNDIDSKKSMV